MGLDIYNGDIIEGGGSGLTGVTSSGGGGSFTGGTVAAATTFSAGASGDFTGTFTGDGSGLTGIIASSTPFTGGTVAGSTTFTNGVTTNTISATTLSGDGTSLTGTKGVKFINNQFTSGTTWSPIAVSNANGTGALTANRLYIVPFILVDDITVNKLAFEVTTFGVLSSVYAGVYELDSNYLPVGAPVINSTAISTTTNGLKTYTLSATTTLTKNKWYGLAAVSDVNVTLRSWVAYPYFGILITSAVHYTCMYRDLTPGFTTVFFGLECVFS